MTWPAFRRAPEARPGLIFGEGALARLADEPMLAHARVLVLCSPSTHRGGAVAGLLASLGARAILRTDTGHHVPAEAVARMLVAGQGAGAIVSIGGGSVIGLGKAVSVRLEPGAVVAHVAVTTTYSGSEQNGTYGITEAGRKNVVRDPHAQPALAVYDPVLTLGLPAGITAGSGLNALAHCVEVALLGPADPESRAVAREGTQHILAALPACVADGADRSARAEMLIGAMLAARALVLQETGMHHALCQVLGGRTGLSHGALNAVMLPRVVAFNAGFADAALAGIAGDLGAGTSEPCRAVAAAIRALNVRLGLPASLEAAGVPRELLGEVAALAFPRPALHRNPRPVGDEHALLDFLQSAWTGETT